MAEPPPDADMEDVATEPLVVEEPGEPMEGVSITEVAPEPEPASSAEDPLYGEYTWRIPEFSKLQVHKLHSEIFEAGGYYWNLLIFPKGNNSNKPQLSVYLNVPDMVDTPQRRAKFELVLFNTDPTKNVSRDTEHTFAGRENDWGFTGFHPLAELLEPGSGFLPDDTMTLKVKLRVEHPDSYLYNSKRETGFVGLKNQGATCYMNSLLQTLFNLNFFRKAVYHMPTSEDEQPSKSIPLALQSLFYKLQFGDHSVSTKDLTQSFGWTTADAFTQHDVQELNRILSDKLEDKMKGTKVEGTIGRLFEGRIHNFVECCHVDYASTRQEVFADLQLLVKGCAHMHDSFDKYCEVEALDGANQYMAEGHGLQDAKKGMLFDAFPPVLQIQLRRFEYDFARDTMIKINDRYEFPEELDLDREDGKYLSPNADRSVRNKYRLHSVLVHSGGIHGGHYYAYINPTGRQWLKFDDERVTKEDARQALEEQYGGQDDPPGGGGGGGGGGGFGGGYKVAKFSNAYMLVYVRESDWEHIMCEVGKEDLAAHVRARLEAEQAEKRRQRKEREESHLYTVVKAARDSDLRQQIGSDRFFDLVDHDKVASLRVKKFSKFADFRARIEAEWGIPAGRQLWWGWEGRDNKTYRPCRLLGPADDAARVCDIKENSARVQPHKQAWPPRLHLYLQEDTDTVTDLMLDQQASGRRDHLLLFLKRYLPREQRLEYAGTMVVPRTVSLRTAERLVCKRGGLEEGRPWQAWEEVKFHRDDLLMVCPVDLNASLAVEQLQDGDILILQEQLSEEEAKTVRFAEAPDFLSWVRNRQLVTFKRLEDPKEAGFQLELSCENTYEEVAAAVAAHLGLPDPRTLRFTGHLPSTQGPRPQPFPHGHIGRLPDMLAAYGGLSSDTLYYEPLDLPLEELEKLRVFQVGWHGERGELVRELRVRVRREGTVAELLAALRAVDADAAAAQQLRLLEMLGSKIYKVWDESSAEGLESIHDGYWAWRAEAVPADELGPAPEGARLAHLSHVSVPEDANKQVQLFGDPLAVRVGGDETAEQLTQRIQTRLGVPDEEWAKWRFCLVKGSLASAVEWLQPEQCVAEALGRVGGQLSAEPPFIGLHHAVQHSKRPPPRASNGYAERAIKIYS